MKTYLILLSWLATLKGTATAKERFVDLFLDFTLLSDAFLVINHSTTHLVFDI